MGLFWQMARAFAREHKKSQRENDRIRQLNEKWQRLNQCVLVLKDEFIMPLIDDAIITNAEDDRLAVAMEKVTDWADSIDANINSIGRQELSQYATSIKNLTLMTIKLCAKYSIFTDIESVRYNTATKTILLNEEPLFYLG